MIGSDSVSAFLKSFSKTSPSALPALASPNCSMRRSGLAACAAATAASGASTRSSVTSKSPASWKLTSTERPSGEIWPALPAVVRGLDVRDVRRAPQALLDVGDGGS